MFKLIEKNTDKKYSKPCRVTSNFVGWIDDYEILAPVTVSAND